jgi:hypothetical protein
MNDDRAHIIQNSPADDEVDDLQKQVFVINVPSFTEVSHHSFIKMFEACGKVQKYKIYRHRDHAIFTFETVEGAQKALLLDKSYTSKKEIVMYVNARIKTEEQRLFSHFRNQRWHCAYLYLRENQEMNQYFLPHSLKLIAHYYELIATQHFGLFYIINEWIDKLNSNTLSIQHSLIPETSKDLLHILQVRKEGWFARKEITKTFLCDQFNFSDDVIKHILIEYLF